MNEIAIRDMGELNSVALTVAKSGLFGAKTPEQAFVAIATGMELGLKPMQALRNIVVVQGRPTFSADGGFAVVRNHPEYGGIRWEKQDDKEARCVITRISKGGQLKEEFPGSFTIKEAATAGLANKDNWKNYPARMLRARALSYACRDAFPDVLNGLYTPDEIAPDTPAAERDITEEAHVCDCGGTCGNGCQCQAEEAPAPAAQTSPAQPQVDETQYKGGLANPIETARLKELLTTRYPNGQPVFTREEMMAYNSYRRIDSPAPGPMSAAELISFVQKALDNRILVDANAE
jgi:hypothetical protein